MLVICFIIALIISIVLWIIGEKIWSDGVAISGEISTVLSGAAIVISLLIIIVNYIYIDAEVAGSKQTYDSLVYQYENNIYEDDLVGKKELYNQIQDWNEDVVYFQTIQDNFWVGIYYPNVYDQFETIPLK